MKAVRKFHIFDSIYKMSRKGNAQGQSGWVVGLEGAVGGGVGGGMGGGGRGLEGCESYS